MKKQAVRIENIHNEGVFAAGDSNLGAVVRADERAIESTQQMKEEMPNHG